MGGPPSFSSHIQALISTEKQLRGTQLCRGVSAKREMHFPELRGGLEASVVQGVLLASPLIRMALGIWGQGEAVSMR